jgi:predicted nucleotidyltransferase component of viral defense system
MSVQIIRERLRGYDCQTVLEEQRAIREITQEVILAALGRGDFFKHALFQGGTCLRILYGLNRFSEDLDFILRKPDASFRLKEHLLLLTRELSAYGYQIEITAREQTDSAVRTAFVKDHSLGSLIDLRFKDTTGPPAKIRIKLEVDTNPPAGSGAELKYLDFPFVSAVAVQDMPSLFSGKVHALLCREYVKGRDWYDFIWYTSRKSGLNEAFLSAALDQAGPWKGQGILVDKTWATHELEQKISSIDWKQAAEDVRRFLPAHELPSLDLWSKDLFLHQLDKWRRGIR